MLIFFDFHYLLPITTLLVNSGYLLFDDFFFRATQPVALFSYWTTFLLAFLSCICNSIFGFILAWVLVRYKFPTKNFIDICIDLPFALPTSVAGLTFLTIYNQQGWLGFFLSRLGIQVVYTKLAIFLAMTFVSFPFVIRSIQPILQNFEKELEEISWSLGASSFNTFRLIIFPNLFSALITGMTLSLSRAIGEYGSIAIVSSNFPFKDLVVPVLIFQYLEQYDYTSATVIGTVVLLLSLIILIFLNFLQNDFFYNK
uniref:Sulfate transport system permease protein CysT n=1 Tax=Halicoryne sp. HV04044 TaxID=2364992 RepID=A0A386JM74_9CHLO|nr:sulfate ABC transporter protein [Halicoryne sp. HV04044]